MKHYTIEENPLSHFLFNNTRVSWFWLVVRLYVGYEWLSAAWEKVTSPAWTGAQAGSALSGFLNGALAQVGGAHPNVQGWYAAFLKDAVLPNVHAWSYAVSYGELAVGVALVLGAFTGIAAFFGLFMNLNYLMAGTVSTNPILFVLAIGLILAWKTAGWFGFDRWLVPLLGTPWHPGKGFRK
ncbi:MAG: DoxX family membrane protein [Patescibacteria group bacterium]|nr:DoxX family membrane protein [Patescibacteria group bacterium]